MSLVSLLQRSRITISRDLIVREIAPIGAWNLDGSNLACQESARFIVRGAGVATMAVRTAKRILRHMGWLRTRAETYGIVHRGES